MANEHKTPDATDPKAKPPTNAPRAARKPDEPEPATKGEKVLVVVADGTAVEATVTGGVDNLADVEFKYRGAKMEITSSPYDPDGKTSDSWHRA